MKYLVCEKEGGVIDVIEADDFESAIEASLGRNYGEFLVELDKDAMAKVSELEEAVMESAKELMGNAGELGYEIAESAMPRVVELLRQAVLSYVYDVLMDDESVTDGILSELEEEGLAKKGS